MPSESVKLEDFLKEVEQEKLPSNVGLAMENVLSQVEIEKREVCCYAPRISDLSFSKALMYIG
jgi:hypothetical protein